MKRDWKPASKGGSKYNNVKTIYKGREYHSKKEADYAMQLDQLMNAKNKADRVKSWTPQVSYHLVVNKKKICTYILDFLVVYADGRTEHIDVKGVITKEYSIKKKLMLAVHNIAIKEV